MRVSSTRRTLHVDKIGTVRYHRVDLRTVKIKRSEINGISRAAKDKISKLALGWADCPFLEGYMAVLGRDHKGKITYRDSKGEVIWDKGAVSSKGAPNLNLLDLLLRC